MRKGIPFVAALDDRSLTDVFGIEPKKLETPPGFEPGMEVLQTGLAPSETTALIEEVVVPRGACPLGRRERNREHQNTAGT